MEEIHGNRALIVGFGREGQSTRRYLEKHSPQISIVVTDRKDGKDYLKHIGEYSTVLRSPGVPSRLQELVDYKKSGGWITSATNIFFSRCPGITVGVTGTKGKSTTASLIAHILKQKFPDVRLVGNIGRPMLDHLDGAAKGTIFVVELSSHQLEDIRYSPHVAVLLAIVPEHLDYYSDFSAYVSAKSNIVKFQKKDDVVIFHPRVQKIAERSLGKKIPLTQYAPSTLLGNRVNVRAAITVAKYFGVTKKHVLLALRSFAPLPHRLEFVGEYRGARFYNDSLATIPEATIHALEALGKNVTTLIAGGFDRGLSYKKLGEYLAKKNIKTLILFPDTGEKIWEALRQNSGQAERYDITTMEEAVKLAFEHTSAGKICLLSPASASFNLFKDYADRGDQFKTWVKKMGVR